MSELKKKNYAHQVDSEEEDEDHDAEIDFSNSNRKSEAKIGNSSA